MQLLSSQLHLQLMQPVRQLWSYLKFKSIGRVVTPRPLPMLSFAISLAKNWGQLATLQTMWKVIFIPTLMISLCLEVWPAAPVPLSSIRKLATIILKNPKGGPFYVKKIFVSDFNEIQNLKSL